MRIQRIYSKMKKTKVLLENEATGRYIPLTLRMNRNTLFSMLEQWNMVYVKPNSGMFGNGVMRVEKITLPYRCRYRYQINNTIRTFTNYHKMYESLLRNRRGKNYLVQRGIHLLRYKNRPFDVRVMVQKSPHRNWETTGIICRVAHPKKIVTNFHNGGTLMPLQTLLKGYMSSNEQKSYIKKLNKIGKLVARQIEKKFPRVKELGLDIGIQTEVFYPWLLEVNTSPDPFIFTRLKDKRVFRKVYRYSKAYGGL